jgi:hypothetical protein
MAAPLAAPASGVGIYPTTVTLNGTPTIPAYITMLSKTNGEVGTAVTIIGSGFTGVLGVQFGEQYAPFTFVSDTTITATAPTGFGAVPVIVFTSANATATYYSFTYGVQSLAAVGAGVGVYPTVSP